MGTVESSGLQQETVVRCASRAASAADGRGRRRIVHVNGTDHPTSAWAVQQLAPHWHWLFRDRDTIDDEAVRHRIAGLGIAEMVSSPRQSSSTFASG